MFPTVCFRCSVFDPFGETINTKGFSGPVISHLFAEALYKYIEVDTVTQNYNFKQVNEEIGTKGSRTRKEKMK